jgi:uncharacterized membrane protein YjgN (DUF898 family)
MPQLASETGIGEDKIIPTDSHILLFHFTGKASEFFRIWIVNILLTILTLGIYSAWAKVRTKRYFYANTYLDGTSFDYLAEPIKILKGRLLVLCGFLLATVPVYLIPSILPIVLVGVLLVWPCLVTMVLRFNACNSVYRNIRFSFRATTWEAIKVYWQGWLLLIVTGGLANPWFKRKLHQFRVNNSQLGTSSFSFRHIHYDKYWFIFIEAGIFSAIITGLITWVLNLSIILGLTLEDLFIIKINELLPVCFLLIYILYTKVYLTNILFNNTSLNGHEFISSLKVLPLFWIYLSNTIIIILSVGLLTPWAMIRVMHYRVDNLKLAAVGNLTDFTAEEQKKTSALGEEIAEFIDMDYGL